MGPLQVGTTLHQKYKIERLLAESGGAVLYEATDTARKQRVWIKILQRESLGNAAAMARFQREAAGSKVLDVGKNDAGLPYMVATEFGPADKPAMPPRPKPAKTTLPGVAPPPVRVASKAPPPVPKKDVEEEEAAPLSASDVVMEETPTPAPAAAAGIFSTPPAESNPVLASPLVSTPPPKQEEIQIEEPVPDVPFVEDPIVELPAATPSEPTMKRRRASAQPTVFIDRPKERSQTGVWIVALLLASIVTGGAGWYFGHKDTHKEPPAPSTAMPITTTVTTTTVAAATTTETKPEPPPPPIPTTTATLAMTATVAAPTITATPPPPPPRKPPANVPRKPAPTAHPTSGDPLTL